MFNFQTHVECKFTLCNYPYLYFTDAYFVSNNVGMATAEMVIEIGFVSLILFIICIQYLKKANEPLSMILGNPNTWNNCDVMTWYETAHVKLAMK